MTLIQGVVNTFVIFISRVIAQIAAGFLGGNREDEGESSNGNPLIYFAVATVLELQSSSRGLPDAPSRRQHGTHGNARTTW